MADLTVRVEGLRELRRACQVAGSGMSRDLNSALRSAGEPVRADAQALAVSNITRIGIPWSRMRLGITRHTVYVAPVEKGVKSRTDSRRRRPRLKTKLLDQAMNPALAQNIKTIEREFEDTVRDMGKAWARV